MQKLIAWVQDTIIALFADNLCKDEFHELDPNTEAFYHDKVL
jgi:hypothetical protein